MHLFTILIWLNFWVRIKRIYGMGLILGLCHHRMRVKIHTDKESVQHCKLKIIIIYF